jgi:transposase
MTLVDAIPAVRGDTGRPKKRPARIIGDRAYYSRPLEAELKKRHIQPLIAHRGMEHGSGLGTVRWPVERTFSWLHQNRRLRVRYEKRPDIHNAFLTLGCIWICFNQIQSFC